MNKTYVVNYDDHHYNYKSYWAKRDYENLVEQRTIKKLLGKNSFSTFLDIGGSFGRILPTYYKKATNPIILDYSLETLQRNYATLTKLYPKIKLIAGNAYKLPFKSNTISGGIMVRTLHHIENPKRYFNELQRVLINKALYIQEFANKLHAKAIFKAFLKGNFKFFSQKPYQQPSQGSYEGAKPGEEYVFLNFTSKYIKSLLSYNGFDIYKELGTSFFRIPFLKNHLPPNTLASMDMLLQFIPFIQTLSPSIYLKTRVKKEENRKKNANLNQISSILACPRCKGTLKEIGESELKCCTCNISFYKKKNIWDLRVNE